MGGIGSGARRSKHIGDVEDVMALDIRALRRLGAVQAGECIIRTLLWSIDGLRTPCVRTRVDLSAIERGGTMTITGDMPDGSVNQKVDIEGTPSAFGGWRCYFLCPVTFRRCEVLYYDGGRFASREAQRLSYAVQNMGDLSRARRKVAKLHRRLCGTEIAPRPRGRRRIEIAERLHQAQFGAKEMYFDRLCAISERSGARRMPSDSR